MTPAEKYANEVFTPSQLGAVVAKLEPRPYAAAAGAIVAGVLGLAVGTPWGALAGAIAGGLFGYLAAGNKVAPPHEDASKKLESLLEERLDAGLPGFSAAELLRLRTRVMAG